MASSSRSQPYAEAPEHPLPSTHFFSIEYPGYVQPSSIPTAVHNLGGLPSLENAFKRTATKADALLELSLRPNNPFSHPVPGDVVNTSNLLMKVVKKKRKGVDKNGSAMGEYTAQVVGVIPKTVRFRSEYFELRSNVGTDSGCKGVVDYQYQVDMNDPVAKLRIAMNSLDGILPCLIKENDVHELCPCLYQLTRYKHTPFPKRKKTTS